MKSDVPHTIDIAALGAKVSKILMYTAIVITALGMILYAFEAHETNFSVFTNEYRFQFQVWLAQLTALQGYAIMTLGVLLLMLIPVLRVFFFLLDFIFKKNVLYVIISSLIMLVILLSFWFGQSV